MLRKRRLLLDPFFNQGDFLFVELRPLPLRRHQIVVPFLQGNAIHQFTLPGVARHKGLVATQVHHCPLARIKPEITLALLFVGAVAGVAPVRQKRPNIRVEINLLSLREKREARD